MTQHCRNADLFDLAAPRTSGILSITFHNDAYGKAPPREPLTRSPRRRGPGARGPSRPSTAIRSHSVRLAVHADQLRRTCLSDAEVVAVVPAQAKTRIGAAQNAEALNVHAIRLLDHHAILDGNTITLGAAGRLIPRVRSRRFGRANRKSEEKAERKQSLTWHDRPHGHVDAAETLQAACLDWV
jgi:hypothetical protein